MRRGQGPQRLGHEHLTQQVLRLVIGDGCLVHHGTPNLRRPYALAPLLVDHDTPGHRGQPGHQRRLGQVQPPGLAPGPDHRLLDDVLGLLPVAGRETEHEQQ